MYCTVQNNSQYSQYNKMLCCLVVTFIWALTRPSIYLEWIHKVTAKTCLRKRTVFRSDYIMRRSGVDMDKTCKRRCHCFAIPILDKHKNKSPLSYEPTSAVGFYSQTCKTNSKQCIRSVAVPGKCSV